MARERRANPRLRAWPALEAFLQKTTTPNIDPADLPILPRLWWDDRLHAASKYRWGRKGTIDALTNRDRLMQFVRRNMRKAQKGESSYDLDIGRAGRIEAEAEASGAFDAALYEP